MRKDFLTGAELSVAELEQLLETAIELKKSRAGHCLLEGRSVALIFERPSTRTRISFEVGVAELDGIPVVLRGEELQLTRGESLRDTALVLSRYVSAIVVRTGPHETVEELASYADVPVINALTELHHPCQALADLMTLKERFGKLDGLKLAYVGDGNNVTHSLLMLAPRLGVELAVATPAGYEPAQEVVAQAEELANAKISLGNDASVAASGASAVYTDVWVSMGDEAEAEQRREALKPFQINEQLLQHAKDDSIVLHCLPAHPGEEITEEALYGDRSAVWDQAENRLHAQKALLGQLLQ